ncbi:MAG TPA: mannose-1-phosphate guanylyltransferase/mannose-6-phosphate isomerase [Casimicrobiaceae bacterium]|nr:mannose-1-phosphate guanylyltransferase/mannose-6-phosphate isomerase [Casimicrobiaceae bacterium]
MPLFVPVVLSGGAGTRLWPLSRESAPKPFMPLPDGGTLLGKTAARARRLEGAGPLVTVTNRDYYFATKDVYATAGGARTPEIYLLEPFGRNTSAAIALSALWARARVGDDVPLVILPADHLIRDEQAFGDAVAYALDAASNGRLVTFGIAPTRAETGFGYLECEGDGATVRRVTRFVEKPTRERAQTYVDSGRYLWNSGMFCFTPRAILSAFASHAPHVLDAVTPVWNALAPRAHEPMLEIEPALFAAVPDISIDYAVMEKAAGGDPGVAGVCGRFDWSDVGSWQALSELVPADALGNRGRGEHVAIDTRDTFIHAEDRVVAAVGVDNLVIVDTPDATLVAHRDQLQRVKDVVGELKARGHEAYRLHRTVGRPWGTYTVLQQGPGFKIKRIEVKPAATLSLQLHHRRSEHWIVVCGIADVTRGDDVFPVKANESTYIPVNTKHRLGNSQGEPLVMIEVQCGDYLGEDDIVRFDDQYGRITTDEKRGHGPGG